MSTTLSLVLLSMFSALLSIAYIHSKGRNIGAIDLHLLSVIAFFSAYTILDVLINPPAAFDTTLGCWALIHVLTASLLSVACMHLLPGSLSKKTSVEHLSRIWSTSPYRTINLSLSLVLVFYVYLFVKFGAIANFSEAELELLGVSMPSWIGPVRSLLNGVAFSIFLFAIASLSFGRRQQSRNTWAALILSFIPLAISGRRSLVVGILVAIVIYSVARGFSPFSARNILRYVLASLLLLVFSNIYQTYRLEGISIAEARGLQDLPNVFEASTNVEATADNLRARTAMWKFNYLIIERQAEDDIEPLGGRIFSQGLMNSVPSAVWPSKTVIDTDELVAQRYRIPSTDYPTNNFAMLYADFGIAGVLIAPALTLLPIAIVFLSLNFGPTISLFMSGFCLRYLMSVENAPGDIFILMRDCAIVLVLGLFVRLASFLVHRYLLPPNTKIETA